MQIESVTGVLLAGGKSSRMGTDKAWLQVEGQPLIERSIDTLRQCFTHNIIVANQPQVFDSLGLPVIPDDESGLGPIGGLLTALRHVGTPSIFLVACDMPYLNAPLIRDMANAIGERDAVVASIAGRLEPLHAVYRCAIRLVVETQISARALSLQILVGKLNVKILSEKELGRYREWRKVFLNVNTPEEFQNVRRHHGE